VRWRSGWTCILGSTLAVVGGGAAEAWRREPCPAAYRAGVPILVGSTIRVEIAGGRAGALLDDAIGMWEECTGYGEEFPRFVTAGDADAAIVARLETLAPGAGRCGMIARGEIVVFASVRTHDGVLLPCGDLAANLAHELGHVLGLADQADDRRCREHLMAPLSEHSLTTGRAAGRRAQPSECRAVAARWLTWNELAGVKDEVLADATLRPNASRTPDRPCTLSSSGGSVVAAARAPDLERQ
jgi:hypothetical protein